MIKKLNLYKFPKKRQNNSREIFLFYFKINFFYFNIILTKNLILSRHLMLEKNLEFDFLIIDN